ncbi:MAG: asparagine synthase (glutamine-hydrolyzing) [Bacteroidota bacterium]|nr:asparagine synthase (glutamine-hydrolyzing) [Bacteroidota bacterium]MDP3144484.1 asparagine synthase (glutamine-hydrolyzing) [Bacteroidota bacterium]
MCGISGFIDFNGSSSESILENISNTLLHRGPDAYGTNFFQETTFQLGLGHRRLSIIDLSESAKQPMQYNHLWITFNGEIYNYNDIKTELISLGHNFITNSDTEVILHAYSQWNVNCVNKLTGMFAFAIYDTSAEELICFRDRAGVKPFFYYWHEGLFLFSSELKAFHKHPKFKKEINIDSVAAFMQYGNVPTPNCIFNYCFKLKPGHILTFKLKQKEFEITKYWDVYDAYNKPKLDISFSEAKTETEKILTSSFDYRMVSDVPVGVFLSGGYDSACVTALLQKNSHRKLKTFTISVPDIGLNEAPYAKVVSKHFDTEHFEFECTQKEALNLIDDLPYHYDEPFADSSAIPTTLVCKMASQQVKVVLSADGGDEVFAGYNRYDYLMKYGGQLNQLPVYFRKGASRLMDLVPANKIPILKNKYNFFNRYEKLKGLLHDPSPKNMMLSLSRQFNESEIKKLFKKEVSDLPSAYFSDDLKKEFYSPLAYMMAIDYQTYLLDDILQKVDRASMSVSIESREPFLDHRIIELAAQLPDNYKYYQGQKKHIVKEIVHQYIPKELMDRPKMGFAIPIENWLMNELKNKVNDFVNDKDIKEQGIFNLNHIQHLKKEFYLGKKEYALKIWYLLMFQMWYKKWMD